MTDVTHKIKQHGKGVIRRTDAPGRCTTLHWALKADETGEDHWYGGVDGAHISFQVAGNVHKGKIEILGSLNGVDWVAVSFLDDNGKYQTQATDVGLFRLTVAPLYLRPRVVGGTERDKIKVVVRVPNMYDQNHINGAE